MVVLAGGGGGVGHTWSGPNEKKLFNAWNASEAQITGTQEKWKSGRANLDSAKRDLQRQDESLRATFGKGE